MSFSIMQNEKQKENIKLALGALDFSKACQKQWFEHELEFCKKHGGDKHYKELMEFFTFCRTEAAKNIGED